MQNKIRDGSIPTQQLSFYPDTQTEAAPALRLRPISDILVPLSCGDPDWDLEAPAVCELPNKSASSGHACKTWLVAGSIATSVSSWVPGLSLLLQVL